MLYILTQQELDAKSGNETRLREEYEAKLDDAVRLFSKKLLAEMVRFGLDNVNPALLSSDFRRLLDAVKSACKACKLPDFVNKD